MRNDTPKRDRRRPMHAVFWTLLALAFTNLAPGVPAWAEPPIRWETLEVEEDEETFEYQLGYLTVPARRDVDTAGTLELAFVRVPSSSDSPGPPLVYLEGGPGQAATPLIQDDYGRAAVDALRALGDVILLDQRGVGRSRPRASCRWNEPPHPEVFLGTRAADDDRRRRFASCVAELVERGVDLAAFDSEESADDLEDLRRALGAKSLRLLGFSYGTHLALATIRRHPGSVDRAVLVGTEGPDHTWKLPSTADAQLQKVSRLAAADPDVGIRVADLDVVLERVLTRLEKEALVVEIDDPFGDGRVEVPVGPWGLRRILLWDLGDTSDLPVIPALLHQVDRGETHLLEWFVTKRYRQMGSGISAMGVATDCASGASPARRAQIRTQAETSLFADLANQHYEILCPILGEIELGDSYRAPLVAETPVLFVSGTLDARTPPFQAEEVRWGLTSGQHLVVRNAGHEDLLGNPEVNAAILEFLRTGVSSVTRIDAPPVDFFPLTAGRE